jgi:hypothetical protein
MRLATHLVAATAAVCVASFGAQAGQTLDNIKQKGFIQCGVSTGLAGFSNPDDAGNCRASMSTSAALSPLRCSATPRRYGSRR